MTDLVFVDTNVLVYSRDASEKEKQPKAEAWRTSLWHTRAGRISVQVLNEFYVTVTRKLSPGLGREIARAEMRDLSLWGLVPMTLELLETAFELEEETQLSWWDGLIVSAACHAGCRWLLSEDMKEGLVIRDVEIVNPFNKSPKGLGF